MNNLESALAKIITTESPVFSFWDMFIAMSLTTLLCWILSLVYRKTHRGNSYSQSYFVSLFLVGVTTSVVMLIIGSNIARAFSLVGALSIIRFRTAVKDPKDTSYLFTAIVIGMGCGTGFFLPSFMLTGFISVLLLVIDFYDFGMKKEVDTIIKVTIKDQEAHHQFIEQQITGHFRDSKMINRIMDYRENFVTNVYVVKAKNQADLIDLENKLRGSDFVAKLTTYKSDQYSSL